MNVDLRSGTSCGDGFNNLSTWFCIGRDKPSIAETMAQAHNSRTYLKKVCLKWLITTLMCRQTGYQIKKPLKQTEWPGWAWVRQLNWGLTSLVFLGKMMSKVWFQVGVTQPELKNKCTGNDSFYHFDCGTYQSKEITFNNYTAKATGSDLKESCRYFTTQALGPTDLNLERPRLP